MTNNNNYHVRMDIHTIYERGLSPTHLGEMTTQLRAARKKKTKKLYTHGMTMRHGATRTHVMIHTDHTK